jgi:hypothetical protein
MVFSPRNLQEARLASIFISYSHEDEKLKEKLDAHLATLKKQGLIDAWHDREIKVGDSFDDAISTQLNKADVILLLVSSDFLNSSYIENKELARAIARHQVHEARVIPVILRYCDWQNAPFGRLTAAPKDGQPILSDHWPFVDAAFLNVVNMIRAALPKPEPTVKRKLAFRIIPPGGQEFKYTLPSTEKISIGRSNDNDLVFSEVDLTVSRHHCYALILRETVVIQDRDSTNTPIVNGVETTNGELRLGQQLELGDTKLILEAQ